MNKPCTIRAEHKTKYTIVTNALAQDTNLTYAARGMLLTLLSYPDDWIFRPGNLRQKGCGYNQVYKLLNELIEAGYLKRDEDRNEKKQRITSYTVSEIPIKPSDENHDEVKPSDENHHDENHHDENHHVLLSNEGKPSNQGIQSNDIVAPVSLPSPDNIPIPTPSQTIAPTPRQPSMKLPPIAGAYPSKNGNGTDTISPPAAPKKPKKAKEPEAEKPQKQLSSTPLWNAIADSFYDGVRSNNPMLVQVFNGNKKKDLKGIITLECERQHLTPDKLDYRALAEIVKKFHKSLPIDRVTGKPFALKDPSKWLVDYEGWRNTTSRVDCPPKLFYDPNCPHHCDEGRIYTFDEKGFVKDADDCICVTLIKMERQGIKL